MSAITRLAFLTLVAVFGCAGVETCALAAGPAATSSGPTVGPVLENGSVALVFDRGSGSLVALRNKLAGETYSIRDDRFCITAEEFQIEQLAAKLVSVELQAESWKAKYEVGPLRAEVVYMLGGGHSFAQKRITLRVGRDCRLKKILVSRLAFSAPDLEIVRYRYPQFGRSPGTEPISTFFGRTPRGGFCTGLEMPFDASSLEDRQVALAYAPSLKIKAGEELACARRISACTGGRRQTTSLRQIRPCGVQASPCRRAQKRSCLCPRNPKRWWRRPQSGSQGSPRLAPAGQGGRLGAHPRRSGPGVPVQPQPAAAFRLVRVERAVHRLEERRPVRGLAGISPIEPADRSGAQSKRRVAGAAGKRSGVANRKNGQ